MDESEVLAWLNSEQGRYILNWEQGKLDQAVADVFGYHAVQLSDTGSDFLRCNRIPLRVRAGDTGPVEVRCDLRALPFAANSLDLIVLPHVLEFHPAPHQVLREIERVLMPEGQVHILGFNPLSLWGLKRRFGKLRTYPWSGQYLSVPRLRDWLSLLGFEVDRGAFGCYAPPFAQQRWLQRWRFMEKAGDRWWGFAGGVYFLRAIKRQPGIRLITPRWEKKLPRAKSLRPVAKQSQK